ncbi:mCG1035715 [Mus musculus]|nr:mCG1035715 [Mus musculus]
MRPRCVCFLAELIGPGHHGCKDAICVKLAWLPSPWDLPASSPPALMLHVWMPGVKVNTSPTSLLTSQKRAATYLTLTTTDVVNTLSETHFWTCADSFLGGQSLKEKKDSLINEYFQ